MKNIFKFKSVSYLLLFGVILMAHGKAIAQDLNVSGTVNDENGMSLPGVTVLIKDTSTGTTTDFDGKFELMASSTSVLSFSYMGYVTQEITVGTKSTINISMEPDAQALSEVVVTALGIARDKQTLGYAVQEVQGEALTLVPESNVVNSLSGKVAGVQVTSGGSGVGSSSRIVIRGNASFSGNQPLFVVDGTPIDNSSPNLAGAGGVDWGNTTSDIDPNNIESVSVLKGANASALYGSRAANGVIIITTKKGSKSGKSMGVTFNSSVVFDKAAYLPNLQNEYGGGRDGSEYIYNRYNANNGTNLSYNDYAQQFSYNYVDGAGGGINDSQPINWGPRLDSGLLLDQWSTGENSPWVSRPENTSQWFDTGLTIQNNVSITSNGEKASGRVSYMNINTDGIVDNTDQTENILSANLNLTPTDRLTASVNFNYVNKESDNLPTVGYAWADIFGWLQRDYPTQYAKDLFYEKGNEDYMFNGDNPFYSLRNTNSFNRERVYGNASLSYKINDWLSFNGQVGVDFYNEIRKTITQSGTTRNIRLDRGGQFSETHINKKEVNTDVTLNFDKTFNNIRIDGLIGANRRTNYYTTMGLSASDLTVPDLYTISNVKGTPGTSMYESNYETNSAYFAFNGSYKKVLYLGVTGRNDWSSTLPQESWSYFYPSVSAGLDITQALSMNSNLLSYAKLRGSWAKVGGDTDPYQLDTTYSAGSFNGVSVFTPSRTLPPTGLQPEETTSYEIGADIRFWKNRIGVDFTYYTQTTVNQILSVTTSTTTGYSGMLLNAGEIENKGVELMVSAGIIENPEGLNWDVVVNYAQNKSTVNSLYGNLESYQISSGFGGVRTLAIPGEEWGVLWGLPFVKDDNGKTVVSANGTPLTTSNAEKLGNITPDWTGGISNTLRYKNVSLNFLIDAQIGGDMFSTTAWHSYPTGSYENTVKNNVRETGLIVDGVFEDGTPNDVRVSAQEYYNGPWVWNNHEYSILDATYVKLREMSIGYAFNMSQIDAISKLNLSLVGRNLAILYQDDSTKEYGLDPEVGFGGGEAGIGYENFQVPTTRSIGFKLTASF
ncbi:SusC/RagA family TonB-linked outer membrane protein [Formosa sp. 4Alg 33]|uniref:SusC/RagA family TonB-linked outer membrane protein n=1 Tax=Formosa sp. 4Alg 33 TaxID=3382189 RepID=UPI003D9C3D41